MSATWKGATTTRATATNLRVVEGAVEGGGEAGLATELVDVRGVTGLNGEDASGGREV